MDAEGAPTQDTQKALSGLLMPLGGYKGSGLGMWVEILCGVLGGGAWAAASETTEPPPSAPAEVGWNAGQGRLSLRYHGGVILEATVGAEDAAGRALAGVRSGSNPP
jgi:hypothetical protein